MRLGNLPQRRSTVAAQREVRHEHDLLLGAVVDDVLVPAVGEVVAVLDRRDRHDLTRPLDLLDADLGNSHVPDLASIAVIADHFEARLQRGFGIDTMEVVELDPVGA